VAGVPNHGGATWAALQYVLGFGRLGHEVLFVEPVPAPALRPDSASAAYFRRVLQRFGLAGSAALVSTEGGGRETVGLPFERVRRFARRADVVVNLAGTLADADLLGHAPARLFVDLDPAFTQVWHTG